MLKASSPSGGNVSVAAKALLLLLRRLAADLRERSRARDESRRGGCWPQGAPRVSGASGGNPAGRIRADGGKRAKHQRGAAIRATDLSGVNGTRASRRARRMRENMPAPREETEDAGEAPSRSYVDAPLRLSDQSELLP